VKEVELFSWSCVYFGLYFLYECGYHLSEVRAFLDVLPDEFVGVLYCTFLPRAVGVGKIEGDSLESLCDFLVCAELATVVGGDGLHAISHIGK